MHAKRSIQIKATFLLVVFALNTMVGLACSLGFDLGFNTSHHHDEETPIIHIHVNGKKHVHNEKAGAHQHNKSHQHDSGINDKTKEDKDNCCHDEVIKLEQQDKSVAKAIEYNSPMFSNTLVPEFYYPNILYNSVFISKVKYFVRSYHPPIPDIRIAIQSFQI